ncbi:hypothetical protein HS088_TW08G00115 [Tripterygium wilfordii]|uniref:Cytokinin hydroxylase n=1 Tax=Tripterygium wilfordii TaxID=458696 RepID=A0A7J7DB47_TRIWF|nr:cytokinin hydroxylase-like [Tripterygium wilfordii]KAF5743531.1 hypothetical protein HS088_TW08G00115 [Tripterygium wilfordii]
MAMEFLELCQTLVLGLLMALLVFWLCILLFYFWVSPIFALYKLRRNGFGGPTPSFPLGNIREMMKINRSSSRSSVDHISHDIRSTVFPYFNQWRKSHGNVFAYWLGTEPFLYIADAGFLQKMTSGVLGKDWGKPNVFKYDRQPLFGNGLVMVEGHDWVRHRHVITPALSPANLKPMASLMVESTTKMLDKWSTFIASGNSSSSEIEIEKEITAMSGEIIAKISFGTSRENHNIKVFEKLRALQFNLFGSNRYVGIPFSKLISIKQTLKARKLGKEIDSLILSIIDERRRSDGGYSQWDLLGFLLKKTDMDGHQLGKTLTTRELVDECKTFFFGGHETTALAITWTLLLLALHPNWQDQLREEIKCVMGDGELDLTKLSALKKLGWVMSEVLRLYPSAPNVQRQAREDIQVDGMIIPKGTNIWIDVVAMNHDPVLWGDDVHQFKPERFKEDINGGCNHKMGFVPFGFGGRMCVGRNLSVMEYKVVLTLALSRFSFSVSPNYCHSPTTMLSLRPSNGLPLIVQPL